MLASAKGLIKIKQKISEYVKITIGILIFVIGVQGIIIPSHLTLGGIGGIAILLHYLFGTPVGLVIIILNIPLYLWGYFTINKEFILKTLYAVTLSSILIDLFKNLNVIQTNDPFLGAVFGGIVVGIGGGICYSQGGSAGGADIISKALNKKYGIGLGLVGMLINIFVIGLVAFYVGPVVAMYTIVSIFVSSKVIDAIQIGLPTKITFIISDKSEEIALGIVREIGRGVTVLRGEGAYTHASKNVLLCAVHWVDLYRMKNLVSKIDPAAFIIIGEASEILGKGFRSTIAK